MSASKRETEWRIRARGQPKPAGKDQRGWPTVGSTRTCWLAAWACRWRNNERSQDGRERNAQGPETLSAVAVLCDVEEQERKHQHEHQHQDRAKYRVRTAALEETAEPDHERLTLHNLPASCTVIASCNRHTGVDLVQRDLVHDIRQALLRRSMTVAA